MLLAACRACGGGRRKKLGVGGRKIEKKKFLKRPVRINHNVALKMMPSETEEEETPQKLKGRLEFYFQSALGVVKFSLRKYHHTFLTQQPAFTKPPRFQTPSF